MAGSTLGTIFSISTWGESHGTGIGVVIDGCPAGLSLDTSIIQAYLDRRKPGQTKYSTPRKESDTIQILSGIFEGKTTGTPISMIVYNLKTILNFRTIIDRDMLILLMIKNMDFVTIEEVEDLLEEKQLQELRLVQLLVKY